MVRGHLRTAGAHLNMPFESSTLLKLLLLLLIIIIMIIIMIIIIITTITTIGSPRTSRELPRADRRVPGGARVRASATAQMDT